MYYVYRVSKDGTVQVRDTKDGVIDVFHRTDLFQIINKGYQIFGIYQMPMNIHIVAEFPVKPKMLHYFIQMFGLCENMIKQGKSSMECKKYFIEQENIPQQIACKFVDTYDATCHLEYFKEKLIEKMCKRYGT